MKKLLLGNLRTNCEGVMLPSSESKIKKKKTIFIDQSAFSTFALYVITIETEVLLERKTYLVKDLSEPKVSISI